MKTWLAAEPNDWPKGMVLLNDFVVERELGAGGMGKVYLVKSRSADHQFAVKRTKNLDEGSRRNFQTELQVWIELPDYPHLVACRFFRTIESEITIFAQYVEGGSLADWIKNKKLTSVPQILDVAIQSAWGLHVLHELGLIHQDMKPGNVLMTSDGLAKVTDFGLSKARVSGGEQASDLSTTSIFVSSGGRTPAYCSPEQAMGQKLSRQTDIWSWAVSVLEMFTGEVTWAAGQAADVALGDYLANLSLDPDQQNGIAPMPRPVAGVLRKCLRQNPSERWSNLAAVAMELKKVYREVSGRSYSRQMPSLPTSPDQHGGSIRLDNASVKGLEWLKFAFRAAGREAPDPDVRASARMGSPKVQAIANLSNYDEAQRILEALVARGRLDLEVHLTSLCLEKATLHKVAEDYSGALSCYDRAIGILRRGLQGDKTRISDLARALSSKASFLHDLGEIRASIGLADEAIQLLERLVRHEEHPNLKFQLAEAYGCKAKAAYEIADYNTALDLFDREIAIWLPLEELGGPTWLSNTLACAYMHKACVIWSTGDAKTALIWHGKAIEIWERLVNAEGRQDLSRDLAKAYYNKAITTRSHGDSREALVWHDKAEKVYERLVHQEGQWKLANELSNVYIAEANALGDLKQFREAVERYERAIEIYDILANQQGRQEFAGDLARVRALYASNLIDSGERDRGLLEADRAIPVLEREVARTGRSDLKDALVRIQKTIEL